MCAEAERRICLVPLAGFDQVVVTDLAERAGATFPAKVVVLANVELPLDVVDRVRKQIEVDRVIDQLHDSGLSARPECGDGVFAFTHFDLFDSARRWRFSLSQRSSSKKIAVMSSWRMRESNDGVVDARLVYRSRLEKMLAKNVGRLTFKLPLSDNTCSFMFDPILGIPDLDRICAPTRSSVQAAIQSARSPG